MDFPAKKKGKRQLANYGGGRSPPDSLQKEVATVIVDDHF